MLEINVLNSILVIRGTHVAEMPVTRMLFDLLFGVNVWELFTNRKADGNLPPRRASSPETPSSGQHTHFLNPAQEVTVRYIDRTGRTAGPNNPRTGTDSLRRISVAAILAFLIVLTACETESGIAKAIVDEEPEFRISAAQLAAEYESDESAANDKYKGKVIIVSGIVSKVYRGFLYTPYVDLEGGVRCNFSDTEDPVMQEISEGQTISMKGQGDRLFIGVELRGCTVE